MSELPAKGTFKLGGGYDAPWLTLDGANPDDLNDHIKAALNHPELAQNIVELSNVLKAAYNVAPLLPGNAPEAPVQQPQAAPQKQGWGSSPAAQQQGAAPQAPRQGGNHPAAQLHPEGKTCDICPNVLEFKKTQGGKAKWQCPDWRWNNGNPNGHGMEWIS